MSHVVRKTHLFELILTNILKIPHIRTFLEMLQIAWILHYVQ